jgi:endo-1,4-beta-mannosidase
MEEFGIPNSSRTTSYATWFQAMVSTGLAGDLIWYFTSFTK